MVLATHLSRWYTQLQRIWYLPKGIGITKGVGIGSLKMFSLWKMTGYEEKYITEAQDLFSKK